MLEQKRPLENYIGASWLAQQCEVSRGVIHDYAVRKKLRYYLFMGIRYLERNDAIALVKYLIQQQHEINLPKIVVVCQVKIDGYNFVNLMRVLFKNCQ